ncbi:MAG: transglycosylase domain-containing protein [Coriobacteriia bacterium]|nr:transglycosylase domain-containing protein [Coriobacteriia bacterium]
MASRVRRARRHDSSNVSGLVVLAIFIMIIAAIAAAFLGGIKVVGSWLQDLPDYTDADSYLNAEPTKILDADGNLIAQLYLQNRETVGNEDVVDWVKKATVDVEDVRFYSHKGVDPQGIARAAYITLSGQGTEGASTITQQLVRNTVLSDEQFEQTLRRKVREAYIALELEKQYNKDEILMMYLNTIYYGAGAYGIEAASQTYFGKSADELDLAESALLAGVPNSPSAFDPTKHLDASIERRNLVLRRMRDAGDITEEQFNEASNAEVVLNYTPPSNNGTLKYPYFVDYVKSILLDEFNQDFLFKSGLTIKTTLDPTLQAYAEEAVLKTVGEAERLEASLVSVDPNNGHIVAMVGGKDYSKDQFNLATQARRQPGSAFKVYTLVSAIKEGMDPETLVNASSPAQITDEWEVKNYANENAGIVSLREATWRSLNTAYGRVIREIGPQVVVDTAEAMGITSKLSAVPAITLGVYGTSPLEEASAFGTLATGGIHRDPIAIVEIYDRNNKVIYQAEDTSVRALDASVASVANDVLKGVFTDGTARYGNPQDGHIYAGKTGTSQNVRDLWLVGYTTSYSTAVWVGYRQEAEIRFNGSLGTTRALPSPIFKAYMSKAMQGKPKEDFPSAPHPEYKPEEDWELDVQKEDTNTIEIYIESLLEQYPGYSITTELVLDEFTPPGQVVRAEVDDYMRLIKVYVSVGPSDGENLEDLFNLDDLNGYSGNFNGNSNGRYEEGDNYGGFYAPYDPGIVDF